MRQPHLDTSHWEDEVKKTINVFGARSKGSEAKVIADYLAKNYGSEEAAGKHDAGSGCG